MHEPEFLGSQECYHSFSTASNTFEVNIMNNMTEANMFKITNLIGFLGTINNSVMYLIHCSINDNYIAAYYRQSNAWVAMPAAIGSFILTSPPNGKIKFQFFQVSGNSVIPHTVPVFSTISLSIEFYKQ
jgi:hypothetical protein